MTLQDNSQQAAFWNGRVGAGWVQVEDLIDRMVAPLTEAALDAVGVIPGERLIDVGCGCGTTTMALAERGAAVWGLDLSRQMIERAKAKPRGGRTVAFSVGDAATQPYTPDHQCLFSRFGVMFFADPVAAFANLRTALVPGGRVVFLVWQAPAKNPWIALAGQALQPFQPADAPVPGPEDPGPFALADPARTTRILNDAGFVDVVIEPVERILTLGASIDDVIAFQSRVGPLAALLESAPPEQARAAELAVREAFGPHCGADGVRMPAAAWLVRARC